MCVGLFVGFVSCSIDLYFWFFCASTISSNPNIGHIPRENHNSKRYMHPVFSAALFTIARTWKQLKCPSIEEWIKKMWCIYTMEYYSAIKRNEIGSFEETWMDLESVIQSKVSQKEKNKYHILTHICGI